MSWKTFNALVDMKNSTSSSNIAALILRSTNEIPHAKDDKKHMDIGLALLKQEQRCFLVLTMF